MGVKTEWSALLYELLLSAAGLRCCYARLGFHGTQFTAYIHKCIQNIIYVKGIVAWGRQVYECLRTWNLELYRTTHELSSLISLAVKSPTPQRLMPPPTTLEIEIVWAPSHTYMTNDRASAQGSPTRNSHVQMPPSLPSTIIAHYYPWHLKHPWREFFSYISSSSQSLLLSLSSSNEYMRFNPTESRLKRPKTQMGCCVSSVNDL